MSLEAKGFRRTELRRARSCDPKSFRTMMVNRDTRVVICCPRGKFKRGRCQGGMVPQSKLKRRAR